MKKTSKKIGPWEIGKAYFLRTVTHHLTGRLVAVYEQELVFVEACWIADDGRFSDFLKTGVPNESEPWNQGEVIIGRGSLIDCQEWKMPMISVQK